MITGASGPRGPWRPGRARRWLRARRDSLAATWWTCWCARGWRVRCLVRRPAELPEGAEAVRGRSGGARVWNARRRAWMWFSTWRASPRPGGRAEYYEGNARGTATLVEACARRAAVRPREQPGGGGAEPGRRSAHRGRRAGALHALRQIEARGGADRARFGAGRAGRHRAAAGGLRAARYGCAALFPRRGAGVCVSKSAAANASSARSM